MQEWLSHLGLDRLITVEVLIRIAMALATFVVGLILARLVSKAVLKMVRPRATAQGAMLIRRFVFYSLLGLIIASTLHQLGFKLGVLLGAAGILTVAIGFASQTSASNLISGLFVIAERPFVVGDIVEVGGITGEVLTVDLLSVKLRTFDNLFVRVPNETIIKSQITNLTHFPIRRIDFKMGVAYKEDMSKVEAILMETAFKNPLCLEEPRPLFIFQRYGDSALEFQFSTWVKREHFLDLRNSILKEIKIAFDAAGVEIPFPHISLYTGEVTDPFPVRIVSGETTHDD